MANATAVRNASALMISQIITWTLTLVFMIFMRRVLGPESVGMLVVATSIWTLVGVFISFGMDIMLTKEVARDPRLAGELLGTSYGLRIAFYLIGTLVVTGYVWFMGESLGTNLVLVHIVGLSILFVQLAGATQATLQGLETMHYISIANIASKAVNTLTGVTVLLMGLGVFAVAWVMVLAALVLFVLQVWFLYRHHRIPLRFHMLRARAMLRNSLPYVMSAFSMVAYIQVDVLTIAPLVSTTEVGWYDAAANLFGTLLFAAVVFTTVTFPAMARAHAHAPETVAPMLQRSFNLMLIISVPIGLGVLAIADPLVLLLYGEAYIPTGHILAVMGVVLIFMYVNVLLGQYFTAIDRQNTWTLCIFISVVVTIPLNLVLVPWSERVFGIGALGGAFSFLITEVGQFIAGWFLLPKGTLTWATVRVALRTLLAGLLMFGLVWLNRDQFILIPVFVGVSAYVGLGLLFRLVPEKELNVIVQYVRDKLARKGQAVVSPVSAVSKTTTSSSTTSTNSTTGTTSTTGV
ncbi:MAG: flippase [Chloroflexaceae bacterium]|jgi:O-antigen/teichoic acid export membrane protein|nr:flippase [Chloroflexaceae bacterium]